MFAEAGRNQFQLWSEALELEFADSLSYLPRRHCLKGQLTRNFASAIRPLIHPLIS